MLADAANILIFLDKASEQNKFNNNTACTVISPQADSAPANGCSLDWTDASMPLNRQLPKADDHAKTFTCHAGADKC